MASPTEALIKAVVALELEPREQRWSSLSYCVVDAVWSVGSDYDAVVTPLVRRVAADLGDTEPLVEVDRPVSDPVPLSKFLTCYENAEGLDRVTDNDQRTSTSNGILKTEAVIQYAEILHKHGVDTLTDAQTALDDPEFIADVDGALSDVPGDGSHGIRRAYLWMLVGDDHRIKPDRMVMRWLERQGFDVGPADAKHLIAEVSERLTSNDRTITPWMVDHAIWEDERSR